MLRIEGKMVLLGEANRDGMGASRSRFHEGSQ